MDMEGAVTLMTLSAGLLLSLACAMLVEELIFGGLFRLFFGPRLGCSQRKQNKAGHNQ
jgi:hypothetical protein